MSALHAYLSRLKNLFRRNSVDRDMAEQIEHHLELMTEENVMRGMSPAEARLAARKKFGGVEQIKERARDERTWGWIEDLVRDAKFSFRSLRRSPGFSLAVILTLALCIGANTAMVSALYSLILKPLPYRDSGQVVEVFNSQPKLGIAYQRTSVHQYLDYKANADTVESVALLTGWMFNTDDESQAERLIGIRVTPDYFSVLGVKPLLGRFFAPEEMVTGRSSVVVLTRSYWEKRFNADPGIVGRTIRISRFPVTIIGVAPRSAEAISGAPVLLAPYIYPPELASPAKHLVLQTQMYARLKPGVTLGAAQAQLQTLEDNFRDHAADPATRAIMVRGGSAVQVKSVRSTQMESIRQGLLLLQGAAVFVLLIACVNVASLLLARANARQGELAVRQALGASPAALARQLFTEAAWLAAAGAALGLGLAWAALRIINLYAGRLVLGAPPVELDGAVLGFTLGGVVLVALMIGVLPIFKAWSMRGLQLGARGSSRSDRLRKMGGVLVVAQITLALVVLTSTGLLLRSFANIMATPPGFDARKVVHFRVAVDATYQDPAKRRAMHTRLLEKVRSIPGVEAVAYSTAMPGLPEIPVVQLPFYGTTLERDGAYATAITLEISPEFLPTMGVRMLEGRNFAGADLVAGARPVVIVDRNFAQKHFSGRSAVGERFGFGPDGQNPDRAPLIVGVAEVAKYGGLEDRRGEPTLYTVADVGGLAIDLEVRTARAFEDILPVLRTAMREVDPALPIYQEKTMQMNLDEAAANRRSLLWLLGAFAGIGVILVAVGIYGMLNYDVTLRTREIGIRGAIGASRGQIVGLILAQGLWQAATGLVLGLVGALYFGRYLRTLLVGVEPTDFGVMATVVGFLLFVAFLASWLPARRAAKVDPVIALRSE